MNYMDRFFVACLIEVRPADSSVDVSLKLATSCSKLFGSRQKFRPNIGSSHRISRLNQVSEIKTSANLFSTSTCINNGYLFIEVNGLDLYYMLICSREQCNPAFTRPIAQFIRIGFSLTVASYCQEETYPDM